MDEVRTAIGRYVQMTEEEWAEVLGCWQERTFTKGVFIPATG